ncbi:hypothetical protein [Actinoplanes sp. GCM10030250]|uniref:hypothetical protein n=1 Tax=Actinoplanes sp. GCM10030250 TaxID=3273376 RepID=UPI0036229B04
MISDARRSPVRQRERIRNVYGYALVLVMIALFFVADAVNGAYVDLARGITGGQPQGMAIAGWLFFFAPFGALWGLVFRDQKLETPLGYVLGTAVVLLVPLVLNFMPTSENTSLAEIVSGPGGTDLILGLRNGALAGIVPLVVAPIAAFSDRAQTAAGGEEALRRALTVCFTAFVIVTLTVAVVLAG